MKSIPRILLSAAVGVGLFSFFSVILEAGIVLSALFGLGGLIGSFLSFAPKKIDPKLQELFKLHGISPEKIKRIVRGGKKKLRKMRKFKEIIEKADVQSTIEEICVTTEKIFDDFKHDPKDVKAARQFLNYYLDATLKVIEQYYVLSKQPSHTDKEEETLKKVERTLGSIAIAFEQQLKKLYEDDFLDLDSEIDLLEKTIKLDGVG